MSFLDPVLFTAAVAFRRELYQLCGFRTPTPFWLCGFQQCSSRIFLFFGFGPLPLVLSFRFLSLFVAIFITCLFAVHLDHCLLCGFFSVPRDIYLFCGCCSLRSLLVLWFLSLLFVIFIACTVSFWYFPC